MTISMDANRKWTFCNSLYWWWFIRSQSQPDDGIGGKEKIKMELSLWGVFLA